MTHALGMSGCKLVAISFWQGLCHQEQVLYCRLVNIRNLLHFGHLLYFRGNQADEEWGGKPAVNTVPINLEFQVVQIESIEYASMRIKEI